MAGFVSRAEVAELADARGSGPRTRKGVGVRVPSSAPVLFASHLKSTKYNLYNELERRLKFPDCPDFPRYCPPSAILLYKTGYVVQKNRGDFRGSIGELPT